MPAKFRANFKGARRGDCARLRVIKRHIYIHTYRQYICIASAAIAIAVSFEW